LRTHTAGLGSTPSRSRSRIKINPAVGPPVRRFGIRRARAQRLANHHPSTHIPRSTLQAHQPCHDRAVSGQGLIDKMKGVGGTVNLSSRTIHRTETTLIGIPHPYTPAADTRSTLCLAGARRIRTTPMITSTADPI